MNFHIDDIETVVKSTIGLPSTNSQAIGPTALSLRLQKAFKYGITVILMQTNGAELESAASTYRDVHQGGLCKVMWENGTMHLW